MQLQSKYRLKKKILCGLSFKNECFFSGGGIVKSPDNLDYFITFCKSEKLDLNKKFTEKISTMPPSLVLLGLK